MKSTINFFSLLVCTSLAMAGCGSSISSNVNSAGGSATRGIAAKSVALDATVNGNIVTINGVNYTYCADEYGHCSFSGSATVVFGSFPPDAPSAMYNINGPFTGGVDCYVGAVSNTDPAYGYTKHCWYSTGASSSPTPSPSPSPSPSASPKPSPSPSASPIPSPSPSVSGSTVTISGVTYTYCADENQNCSFSGTAMVVFGAFPPTTPSAMYTINGPFTNGVFCANGSVSNSDPAYGYSKKCWYHLTGGSPSPTPSPSPSPSPSPTSTSSTVVCNSTAEGGNATISCQSGQTISSVVFASFGTPSGSCGNYQVGSCNASDSVSVVQQYCLGQATCTIPIGVGIFGDPCPGTNKTFDAEVMCSGSGVSPSPSPSPSASPSASPSPSPSPSPTGGYTGSGSGSWTYDVDSAHASFALYALNDSGYLLATPQSSGNSPYPFSVYDEKGNVVSVLSPVAQSDGTYHYAIPTNRYGYFEIKPTGGTASTLIPALGSRPAGVLTYAVLPAPDTNPTTNFQDDFTNIQGTTYEPGANALGTGTFPWLAYTSYGTGYYSWGECEPNQATAASDCANAMNNDPNVAVFKNGNIMPLFYMNEIPLWATNSTTGSAWSYPPANMSQWQAYLDYIIPIIVQKYSFLPYRRYQITWEPNAGWGWSGTDAQFIQLYQIAFTEIHKYDSAAIVMGPTITNFGSDMQTQFTNYLSEGLANYMDAVSWHPYPSLGQIFPTDQEDAWIAQFRGYANNAKGKVMRFYATESGMSDYEMSLSGNLPVNSSNFNIYHALGNVAMAAMEKNDGLSMHEYFYTADYSAQPHYGIFYNATSAYTYGPSKVSPKVDVPMIRTANEILNHSNAVGRLYNPGGNTNIVALYFQNKHTGVYTAMLFDPSGGNGSIALQTGASSVTQMDAFGNAKTVSTASGVLNLTLSIEPLYIQGLGSGALSGLTASPAVGN